MAFFVTELIHKRLIGFLLPTLSKIRRATSSPSRPASVAIIISLTFLSKIKDFTILNCLFVLLITTVFIFLGMIGKSSKFHSLYEGLYCSGVAFVTRCPNAQVTIYCFPSI